MALDVDRLKGPLFALIRAAAPRVNYYAPRLARVVTAHTDPASGQTTLDLAPEDPAFPTMGGVPLFHGVPGVSVVLSQGTTVLVEFSEGDPARPFCRSWSGGELVASLSFQGDQIFVGGEAGAEPPLKGITTNSALSTFLLALDVYVKAIQGIADPSKAATPPLDAAITALQAALPGLLATNARVL